MKIVKRGLLIILITLFLVNYAYSAVYIKTNLSSDKIGQNSPFEGYVIFNFSGALPSDSPLSFNAGSLASSIELKEVLRMKGLLTSPKTTIKDPSFDSSSSAEEQIVSFNSAGIKVEVGMDIRGPNRNPGDVTVENISFVIEPNNGNPDDIIISIGNKRAYRHKTGSPTSWESLEKDYLRDFSPDGSINIKGGDILCQLVNLTDSSSYKIKTQVKREEGSASVGLNVTLGDTPSIPESCSGETPCCALSGITTSYSEKSCTVEKDIPERREQYLCVYTAGGDSGTRYFSIKTENADSIDKIYSLVNGLTAESNFYIYGDYALYNRILNSPAAVKFNPSYIQSYILGETGCNNNCLLIPLNISTKSPGGVKLKDLKLEYSTFVGSYTQESFARLVYTPESLEHNGTIALDLFNLENVVSPDTVNDNYKFFASLDGTDSNEVDFDVVHGPKAVIRYGPFNPGYGELVEFDASNSVEYQDNNITSYSWLFGDGTNSSGINTTHIYAVGGNYTVKLKVIDSEGIYGLARIAVLVRNESSSNVLELINQTRDRISGFRIINDASSSQIKETTQMLGILSQLDAFEARLNAIMSNYSSMINNTNLTSAQKTSMINSFTNEISQMNSQIPTSLNVDLSTFNSGAASINQIPTCQACGFGDEISRIKLLTSQKGVTVNAEARLVTLGYSSGSVSNFMIIKKDIIGSGINVYEFAPFGFAIDSVLNNVNFTIPSPNVYKFNPTNQIIYKVQSSDLSKAMQTRTAVMPQDLESVSVETGGPPVTIESECGNKICEEDEDEKSCSEDCKPSNTNLYIVLAAVILLSILIIYFGLFFKGGLLKSLGRPKNVRGLFKNEKDYATLRGFVDNSMKRNIKDKDIKKALKAKGWDKKQIDGVVDEVKYINKEAAKHKQVNQPQQFRPRI